MCLCDNIGLVALLLLGWELRASSITVLCVQAVMILSPLLFMLSLYSHSNSNIIVLGIGITSDAAVHLFTSAFHIHVQCHVHECLLACRLSQLSCPGSSVGRTLA